jgi:signal transduction histidine kinase
VSAAVQAIDWVNAGLYGILAVGAFLQWRKGGGRPAFWAALAFGAIGAVVLAGRLPESAERDFVVQVELALLVLFPYLLYKFTTAFERAPRGLERFVGLMTIVLLVWSFALRDVPQEDDAWSTGFVAYLVAFLFHWSLLSVVAAIRLWRAGRGQPSVAQRRMRFLAAASALLTAAILLAGLGGIAGLGGSESSPLSLAVGLLVSLSGLGFILGVAPPLVLRLLWRRPEVARTQEAIARLMRAETPDEVTSGVLPRMLGIVGARAVELRDAAGQIVGSYRLHEAGGDEEVELLELELAEGSLSIWTSRHAPFFGAEEVASLRTLGTLTELALDRARLFSQEQAARQALEDADDLKMNFIALAAHELRTPVAVIHGVIETVERRGHELAAEQRVDLEQMLRAQAAGLKSLVEQLLDLSRLDAHAVAIEPKRIPVRKRVEEIVALSAGDRVGEVNVKVPGDLEAMVDPDAFDRILTNLVTNALRYGRAPIHVSAEGENGRLQVAVEDRGEGVPSEFVPKLFDRFSRSDPSRRRAGGTGLGLAIAHSYAEALAGELRYCEANPHGARFELVLPNLTA